MKVKLFCLPYAGGSIFSYNSLFRHLSPHIEVIPVEYPGHGRRFNEQLSKSCSEIAEDIYARVRGHLQSPYAIYGHSMGALVTYLLAHKIHREKGVPRPLHLFVSGRTAPSMKWTPRYDMLTRDKLLEVIYAMGGMPADPSVGSALMDYLEPILRADFYAVDHCQYQKRGQLESPITVMIGENEDILEQDAHRWAIETSTAFRVLYFSGGHFFFNTNEAKVCEVIENALLI